MNNQLDFKAGIRGVLFCNSIGKQKEANPRKNTGKIETMEFMSLLNSLRYFIFFLSIREKKKLVFWNVSIKQIKKKVRKRKDSYRLLTGKCPLVLLRKNKVIPRNILDISVIFSLLFTISVPSEVL